MNDEELAKYLHLTPADAAIVIPKLPEWKRRVYERMQQVEIEADLWVEGLGPKPKGVLIDLLPKAKGRGKRLTPGHQ